MKRPIYLLPMALLAGCAEKPQTPNIIVILADDLGYGDVSAYGQTTLLTPNIDRLANEGLRMDNGYATSSTSTPSRYALMTGMYPWKNENAKILPGDAPLIISTQQYTMPRMLQQNGYRTGAIGKWHLGMGEGTIDWNKVVTPGADQIGFDYSCLIAATNDRVPTVYVENGEVVGLDPDDPISVSYVENFEGEPTALTNPEMMRIEWEHGHQGTIVNGIPRIGFMKGGQAARWVDEDMADYFMGKVKSFIDQKDGKPFFLYYGLHQPHVPRAPHGRFVGSTGMGPRGDAIAEADWCVGELLTYLKEKGLLENTLIFFSSDNGPALKDGYKDMSQELAEQHGHLPAGGLRGGKYSLFDAGTHVPTFVYWPGTIKPGVSDALFCQIDLAASLGALTGAEVPAGLDSENHLPALLGKSDMGRKELILEAESKLALRSAEYALIPPYDGPQTNGTGIDLGYLDHWSLYDLKAEPAQRKDLSVERPDVTARLKERFYALTEGYY